MQRFTDISLIIPNLFLGLYLFTFLVIGEPGEDGIYLYSVLPNIVLLFSGLIPHFIYFNLKRILFIFNLTLILSLGVIAWNLSYPFYLYFHLSQDLTKQVLILYLVALESTSFVFLFNIFFLQKIKNLIQDSFNF